MRACVCVCVCVREREREYCVRVCVRALVCVRLQKVLGLGRRICPLSNDAGTMDAAYWKVKVMNIIMFPYIWGVVYLAPRI